MDKNTNSILIDLQKEILEKEKINLKDIVFATSNEMRMKKKEPVYIIRLSDAESIKQHEIAEIKVLQGEMIIQSRLNASILANKKKKETGKSVEILKTNVRTVNVLWNKTTGNGYYANIEKEYKKPLDTIICERASKNIMDRNRKIGTLTNKQYDALEFLCKARHEMHADQQAFFFSTDPCHNKFEKYIGKNGTGTLNKVLKEAGFPTIEFNKDIYKIKTEEYFKSEKFSNDYDYDIAVAKAFDQSAKITEKMNSVIENYLNKIDREYGTKYCPAANKRFKKEPQFEKTLNKYREKLPADAKEQLEKYKQYDRDSGYMAYENNISANIEEIKKDKEKINILLKDGTMHTAEGKDLTQFVAKYGMKNPIFSISSSLKDEWGKDKLVSFSFRDIDSLSRQNGQAVYQDFEKFEYSYIRNMILRPRNALVQQELQNQNMPLR